MSYTIYYDKLFLKVPDGRVLPFILCGDNNVWTTSYKGREIRARDWNVPFWATDKKILIDPEELIKNVEDRVEKDIVHYAKVYEKSEEYIRTHYGSAIGVELRSPSRVVNAKKFINWFKTGVKNAVLVEEFVHKVDSITYSVLFSDTTASKHFVGVDCSIKEGSSSVLTSVELIQLQDCLEKHKPKMVYMDIGDWEYTLPKIQKMRKKERKPKKPPENPNVYYVFRSSGGYLYKYTRNGYKYLGYPEDAKRYYTRKEAERYLAQLKNRRAYHADTWEIEKIEKEVKNV